MVLHAPDYKPFRSDFDPLYSPAACGMIRSQTVMNPFRIHSCAARRALAAGVLLALLGLAAACIPARTAASSSPQKASPTPEPTLTAAPAAGRATASAPSASPTPACEQTQGRLERSVFQDPVMTAFTIPFNVYLPPCYGLRAQRYPVVYLLHGYPQDQDHWLELGLQGVLDAGLAAQRWPDMIVVLPFQPEPYFTHTDGGPGSLEQVLLEGLLPYIDEHYRTQARAADRALAGISRGGVWALEIGLRNPQAFGTVAALSPALTVNHARPAYDPLQIVRRAQGPLPRLWISAGDAEPSFQQGIDRFASVLDEQQVDYSYVHASGRHEDAAWVPLLEPLFDFLAAPWPDSGS